VLIDIGASTALIVMLGALEKRIVGLGRHARGAEFMSRHWMQEAMA
jgi:hypothetical protein